MKQEFYTSIGLAKPRSVQKPRPQVWKRLCTKHWIDYRVDEKGCIKCMQEGGEK